MGNNSSTKDNEILKSEIIGIGSVILVTIFSGLGLVLTNFAMAESSQTVEKTATVHVEYSCSMSQTINSAHTLTLDPGRSQENIGTSTFNATCNDLNGYAIYAVGYSGDSEGNTDMIANDLAPTYNIKTGTSGTDSYWAVKLATGNSNISILNSFNDYHAIPTSYTKVAQRTSGAAANESALTSTYKVNVSGSQAAGTYEGKVRFALMNPSTADCPEGYELKDGVCKEKILTLSDIGTMQEMTSEICANTPTPLASAGENTPQYQLMDTRDNKLYWVAKLADGNCWMTQNLDLNITTTGLSSTDTDITTDWNSSSERPPVATLTDASQYNDINNTTSTASWDAGDWYYDGTSSTSCGSGKTTYEGCTGFSSTGNAHYHVGNMYSWGAATAGTGGDITSGQATGSICPKGWRLPMSSGDPSFANLQSKGSLGSTVQNWLNAPYYFTRTGRLWYDSNKLYNAGNYGYYWSSTPRSDSSYAYFLGFNSSSYVSPAYNFGRAMGMAVRCVAW